MSAPNEDASPHTQAAASMSTWFGFIAMCLGMFMAILDIQIVVTSLPAIRDALAINAESMSWIQTTYLIAEIIAIPITGFLTRALSMRRLFIIALSVFVLASIACALAPGFNSLLVARAVQGFAGGCLIPLVFSAVFLMFPVRTQGAATTVAGVLAVLAPTLGPTIGGYITQTYSWPWLFLINVVPGLVSLAVAYFTLSVTSKDPQLLRRLDWLSLISLALALAALEIALKEGPVRGWGSAIVLSLSALFVACAWGFIRRTLGNDEPVAQLRLLRDRNFAIACALSFVFGVGLFSSVYLMPVFLGLVRHHGPLAIGLIMLVTGVAQLVSAPIAAHLESRVDARVLTAGGFLLFAIGLGLSSFQTPDTDFDEMFWPQVIRGVAIMFCLIPPTRLALGLLAAHQVPDGSALFNLMRNLGGAIGISAVDTIIWQRSPLHAEQLGQQILAGNEQAAQFVGIPIQLLGNVGAGVSAEQMTFAMPMIENAALVLAINDAWLMLAVLTASALCLIGAARKVAAPKAATTQRLE